MSVKVTIGVITYNSGKFIKETLDSCLLQLTDQLAFDKNKVKIVTIETQSR